MTCLPTIFLLNHKSYSLKILLVIHAIKTVAFLINYDSILWVPVILQARLMVIQVFLYFPLVYCFVLRILSSIIFQNSIDSSILYISLFIYRLITFQIFCNSSSIINKLTVLAYLCYLYFLILCLVLKWSNYLVKNLDIFWSIYYDNFCYNIITIFFKILFITSIITFNIIVI